MSRLREDIRHSFITMCIRTHYPWQVKVLARQQAFNYYNVYQIALHLAGQCFVKTPGIYLLPCVPERIHLTSQCFGKTSHIHLLQCVPTHFTWQVKVLVKPQAFFYTNVYQNILHLESHCFGKTLCIHLLR